MYTSRIAVVGTGIAGMAAAWLLNERAQITVFEAQPRMGGHTNTVNVDDPAGPLAIDTGFIVFNPLNYPNLTRLLQHLHVASEPTQMSFAVSVDDGALEYSGSSFSGLFGQRRNLFRPAFHRMIADIVRFNKSARKLARGGDGSAGGELGEFLDTIGMGRDMRDHYLLPMTAARRNIRAHYDLGNEFYGLWLDESMTYSSAVFDTPQQSLADAQSAKYRRIIGHLGLQPSDHVLEIGCGWGGFACAAAAATGCRVTGLTLSREQLAHCRALADSNGLGQQLEFRIQDYRDTRERFDHWARASIIFR